MYEPHRKPGSWTLSDIARFVGHDPKTVKKDMIKKGFPKPIIIGSRQYWQEKEVVRFYSRKK